MKERVTISGENKEEIVFAFTALVGQIWTWAACRERMLWKWEDSSTRLGFLMFFISSESSCKFLIFTFNPIWRRSSQCERTVNSLRKQKTVTKFHPSLEIQQLFRYTQQKIKIKFVAQTKEIFVDTSNTAHKYLWMTLKDSTKPEIFCSHFIVWCVGWRFTLVCSLRECEISFMEILSRSAQAPLWRSGNTTKFIKYLPFSNVTLKWLWNWRKHLLAHKVALRRSLLNNL